MYRPRAQTYSILLAALLGALGGGLLVAWVGKLVPRILSQAMRGMMQTMMAKMKESGCSPEDT